MLSFFHIKSLSSDSQFERVFTYHGMVIYYTPLVLQNGPRCSTSRGTTGGTGATGRHFVNRLLLRGCNVTVVVRNPHVTETFSGNRERLNFVVGNVLTDVSQTATADIEIIAYLDGHFHGFFRCQVEPVNIPAVFKYDGLVAD